MPQSETMRPAFTPLRASAAVEQTTSGATSLIRLLAILCAVGVSAPAVIRAQQTDCPSGDTAACSAYRQHLASAATASPDTLWITLRYLATPDDARRWFGTASSQARMELLRRFWEVRAAAAGLHPELRYAEHAGRVAEAERRYPRRPRRRWSGVLFPAHFEAMAVEPPPGMDRFRYGRMQVFVDDRGLALIRHGEPQHRSRCWRGGGGRGEAWVYTESGTARILIFTDAPRSNDYILVTHPSETDCGASAGTMVSELAGFDPELHLFLLGGSGIAGAARENTARLRFQAASDRSARTERAGHVYTDVLEGTHTLLDFIGTGIEEAAARMGTDDAATAQPGAEVTLVYEPPTDAAGSDIHATLILYDSTGIAARRDAVFRGGGSLRLAVPAGSYRYSLRLDAGSGRGALRHGGIVAPAPAGLTVSGIAIGVPHVAGDWDRASPPLALLARPQTSTSGELDLYYEVYGLTPDATFETRIVLEPLGRRFPRAAAPLELGFTSSAPDGAAAARLPQRRRLDLSDLGAGDYRLTVRVRNLTTGAEAARATTVVVRGR